MRGRFTARATAARVTAESERAQLKAKPPDERDVRALTERTERTPFPIRPRSLALGKVRRLPAESRRLVLSAIVSTVSHCHARGVVVSVHAELTLVSLAGDVLISVDLAPNARYSAPETLFAGPTQTTQSTCVAWSLACLLMKLITGNPLVRDDGGDVMSPAQLARVLCVVGALRVRDRDDRDDRADCEGRDDRDDREGGEDREGRADREGGEGGQGRADRADREGGEGREGREGREDREDREDRDRKNGHKGLSALFDALDATKWRNRAPKLKIPRNATATERELLRRSLRWTDRPHLHAFCMARGASKLHTPTLGAIAE